MIKQLGALLLLLVLTACNQSGSGALTPKPKLQSPQSLMVHVAKRMQACWFAKKDSAFRRYRLASEVNSYAGKPRVLIVPKNNPAGLPKLVVQAERKGGRNVLSTFGPLLDGKDGPRLRNSVTKWARGANSCA